MGPKQDLILNPNIITADYHFRKGMLRGEAVPRG